MILRLLWALKMKKIRRARILLLGIAPGISRQGHRRDAVPLDLDPIRRSGASTGEKPGGSSRTTRR